MSYTGEYRNFSELAAHEQEGRDYKRVVWARASEVVIIAPHGGNIEPGTSEIARALAGEEFSLYCFEGLKITNNRPLHITSARFDEPLCVKLVTGANLVVAVHGCRGRDKIAYVGGLNQPLKGQVIQALQRVGFLAEEDDTSRHAGRHKRNICNRGRSRRGLQLEITTALRRAMFIGGLKATRSPTPLFDRFVTTIRSVLLDQFTGR